MSNRLMFQSPSTAVSWSSTGPKFSTLPLQLLVPSEHVGLDRSEHAVGPAEDREREDDLAVLRLLVVTPQQVSHRPDERRMVLDRLGGAARHGGHVGTAAGRPA